MSIDFLYASLALAYLLIMAPVVIWLRWALKARHRRRHAARRRARRMGYVPIYDDQIEPMDLIRR